MKILFPASVLVLILLVLISITENRSLAGRDIEFMSGVSFVAPSDPYTEDPFLSVKDVHADWVAIMPYAFINKGQPEVLYDSESQWWGERTKGSIETIRYARKNGLKVLLKPHVWVRGQGWTGDFRLSKEDDWLAWERSYEKYILNHANYADSLGVEAFCIGLEFKHAIKERPEFWTNLIIKVRELYKGKITYAANWDNFGNIPFWHQVDFIGINAYFPLSQKDTPQVVELVAAWQDKKKALQSLHESYGKPIVFTEFGYRSINQSAGNQWELEHHRRYKGTPNFNSQENAYRAIFETFWSEPWFKGGFLWKWYPDQDNSLNAHNSDYTPQFKPAEKVVREWYKKH
jgi:hypothetical protein